MLAILIICLVIFGAISLPIGIAMGLATMLCLVFATNIDPIMVAQNAFAGIDSFSLMAIPFFMLAGNFMRYGGISKRLLDLADNIVGFFTGGLGAITTFTAMFYAAISGSGPATVSAIGSFMIPEMEENIRYISMKLDENERSNTIRLMKVKDMILQESIEERRAEDARAIRAFSEG